MTAVAPLPPALALGNAVEALNGDITTEEQLHARLSAIQEACSGLVALVEAGGRLPTDLLENALEAVCRGLGGMRVRLEAAAGQLAAVSAAAWSQAALAAADVCLHSEAWHAAWHADAGAQGSDCVKEAYLRSVGLARDMLRDELLPLLGAAAAQQTRESGFCLGAQYQAVLFMGWTAAEVVGMRDPRHRRPGLRNFSVVNTLWNGIQKLWTSVPAEVRPDMERQGLGAAALVQGLLGLVRKDLRACRQLLDPGMGKLLQYWVQKARFVLADYPGAAPTCWKPLLEAAVSSQRELALLLEAAAAAGGGGGGGSAGAAALAEALRGQVVPRAVGLLANCLSWTTAEDQLRVMLDALRMRVSASSGGDAGSEDPAHALHIVLHLLHAAPGLPLLARHHCVVLLGSVLEALPGPAFASALVSAELREQVVDAALVFLAACCHAAATAAGNPALQAWERQLAAQTWERCQQQLFLHALQPHPLTAHVLGSVWSDLAACSSEALLQSHATVVHSLLCLSAAAEAAGEAHAPPSPLYLQLLGLLACVLAAAPPRMLEAYYANFLQLLPNGRDDCCQLSCLAAELRLAALVDSATGRPMAARQVEAVLSSLFGHLHDAAPLVLNRLAAQAQAAGGEGAAAAAGCEEECTYLAWLLDALQCAVAYFATTGAQQAPPCSDLLALLPNRLARLLSHAVKRGAFVLVPPLLCALRDLLVLAPDRLEGQDLEGLVPVLGTCLGRPEFAAAAAGLVPALARCASPHTEVVQAALVPSPPLLQHLGLEAFRLYARACPPENMMKAAPRDPETNEVVGAFTLLLQQYMQRSVAGDAQPPEQEAAAWAAALRQEALGAAAALRRAVEAHRAAAEAGAMAGTGQATGGSEGPCQAGNSSGSDGGEDCTGTGSVAAAAEQVARALSQLDSALGGAPVVDSAAARTLQQCAARLARLLGAPA